MCGGEDRPLHCPLQEYDDHRSILNFFFFLCEDIMKLMVDNPMYSDMIVIW